MMFGNLKSQGQPQNCNNYFTEDTYYTCYPEGKPAKRKSSKDKYDAIKEDISELLLDFKKRADRIGKDVVVSREGDKLIVEFKESATDFKYFSDINNNLQSIISKYISGSSPNIIEDLKKLKKDYFLAQLECLDQIIHTMEGSSRYIKYFSDLFS